MEIKSKFSSLGELASHQIFLNTQAHKICVLFFSLRAPDNEIIFVSFNYRS